MIYTVLKNIYLPIFSFLICLIATPLVRAIAIKRDWVANPTEDRWHSKPTALMGGIAIYLGMAIPLLFVADFGSIGGYFFNGLSTVERPSVAAVIWLCATFLFAVGLFDDFLNIRPQSKLVAQILVSLASQLLLPFLFQFLLHIYHSLKKRLLYLFRHNE